MLEKYIENRLVEGVKALGGECLKWVSPGNRGVPDRIIIMPAGKIYLVELKTEGGNLSVLQQRWQTRLNALGVTALELKGIDEVDFFLSVLNKIYKREGKGNEV